MWETEDIRPASNLRRQPIMRIKALILKLLVCILVSLSCASPQAEEKGNEQDVPQWVTTGVRPRYPSDLYITGVGSAEIKYNDTAAAQAQADARALAQVAKQIEVVIQQRSSSVEREVGSSSGGTLNQRDVWEKTAAFVKIKVEGVRIEDRYHDADENRIYAFASLDRMTRGRIISDEIAALESDTRKLVAEAEKSRQTLTKIYRSVAAYGLAIKKMILAVRKNQYLNVIAPAMTRRNMAQTLSGLQSDVADFMSGFSFEKLSGDNQKGVVGGSLREPLQLRVLYQGNPVPSVPIRFAWVDGSGNIDSSTRSDSRGLVSTTVSNLGPTGKKINKIKAAVNVYPSDAAIQETLETVMPPVYAQFTYELPPVEDIRVAVLINEYNLGTLQHDSFLKNRLVQSLGSMNLKVLKEIPRDYMPTAYDMGGGPGLAEKLKAMSAIADVAVVGEVKALLLDAGSGGSSLFFSRSRAVVKIFDLASESQMGGADLSLKAAGPDRDEAGRRGLEKISVKASMAVEREVQRILFGRQ